MLFHFLRHAPVTKETATRIYGRGDVDLVRDTPEVKQRLRDMAFALPAQNAQVHISPTPRTRILFNDLCDIRPELRDLPQREDVSFIEQDWGDFAGMLQDDIRAHPEMGPLFAEFITDVPDCRAPNGECFRDLYTRVSSRMNALAQPLLQGVSQDHIVIGHGGTLRAAAAFAAGGPEHSLQKVTVPPLSHIVIEASIHDNAMGWKMLSLTPGVSIS